jgi:hypothetical protein
MGGFYTMVRQWVFYQSNVLYKVEDLSRIFASLSRTGSW